MPFETFDGYTVQDVSERWCIAFIEPSSANEVREMSFEELRHSFVSQQPLDAIVGMKYSKFIIQTRLSRNANSE